MWATQEVAKSLKENRTHWLYMRDIQSHGLAVKLQGRFLTKAEVGWVRMLPRDNPLW